MHVLIHYDEIALKRGKRSYFEHTLLEQAEERLGTDGRIDCTRLHLDTALSEDAARNELDALFGVKNYAFQRVTDASMDDIEDAASEVLGEQVGSMAVDAKRSDKSFECTSKEIEERLGDIAVDLGLTVDLDEPQTTLYVEVTEDHAYIYTEKHPGPGGLPVGTAGNVLCLLSGGIDSPVAAWSMMKRGCSVDFLHFNPYRDAEEALDEKLGAVVEVLNQYQRRATVFFAPYGIYQMSATVPEGYDLIAFRNCMLRCAERLADEHGYKGIVTGDNLAQVASQTLENVDAAQLGIDKPIYRPLIGNDKEETVALARRIGTYEPSIREYKDCCSIISRGPKTDVTQDELRDVLEDVDMDAVVNGTLDAMERRELS